MLVKQLLVEDLLWCVRRLPKPIKELLKSKPRRLILAGGFIRSCVANEEVKDVDLFSPTPEDAKLFAQQLADNRTTIYTSKNAFSLKLENGLQVQFIHRWTFERPTDIIDSFDFTIAKAIIYYTGTSWASQIHHRFYSDLAAKKLTYTQPKRNEDVGGSMLRVLKFYQRGYRIPLDSFAKVTARLISGIRATERLGNESEEDFNSRIILGLLHEVDPAIDPEHLAHLPTSEEQEALQKESK